MNNVEVCNPIIFVVVVHAKLILFSSGNETTKCIVRSFSVFTSSTSSTSCNRNHSNTVNKSEFIERIKALVVLIFSESDDEQENNEATTRAPLIDLNKINMKKNHKLVRRNSFLFQINR